MNGLMAHSLLLCTSRLAQYMGSQLDKSYENAGARADVSGLI